ncbi:PIN domain-containing protein [Rhodocyclaceae bacterium SMB388]
MNTAAVRKSAGSISAVRSSADFRTAAVFIDSPLALRTGDALHLAVAHRTGARLASLDRRLNEAAAFHHLPSEALQG